MLATPSRTSLGPMTLPLEYIALAAFSALMAVAAFEDFRRLVIPNALTLALCALWPLHLAAAPSLAGAFGSLGCALAVFVVGAFLFSRGYLGGGDVKLLSAAALWAGPAGTPPLLLLTGLLGGALGLLLLMPLGAHLIAMARLRLGRMPAPTEGGMATPIPYGIAIAAAAVIVTLSPSFT